MKCVSCGEECGEVYIPLNLGERNYKFCPECYDMILYPKCDCECFESLARTDPGDDPVMVLDPYGEVEMLKSEMRG